MDPSECAAAERIGLRSLAAPPPLQLHLATAAAPRPMDGLHAAVGEARKAEGPSSCTLPAGGRSGGVGAEVRGCRGRPCTTAAKPAEPSKVVYGFDLPAAARAV
jgi:hypothetical protein